MVVRKILTKDPVHRDWTLFASNGMGMVLFYAPSFLFAQFNIYASSFFTALNND